jgi:ribosomal protein S18 acetylase RimI-like enzyme
MTVTVPQTTLRPARPEDYAFFASVYASTREEELAQVPFSAQDREAFLAHQFAAQSAHYAQHHGDASYDVIVVDGRRAGRLIVARTDGLIHVVDISLLPEFRGRGAGTHLLESLLGEAEQAGARVSIFVERFNPARRLYERLGFSELSDHGVYIELTCAPGGQAKTAS